MKKKIRIIIISIVAIIVVGLCGFFGYRFLNDNNKLTVDERNWINDNINTVQNISIVNNANVFGKSGKGVYYSFLDDFSKEYNLKINPITFNIGETSSGVSFGIKTEISDRDLVFYEDHYVLIGINNDIIVDYDDLKTKKISVLASDLNKIKKYVDMDFTSIESKDELLESLTKDTTSYVIVPLMEYLDTILTNDYKVVYHFSDIKIYYTMQKDDSYLSRVLTKYYNKWESVGQDYFNKEEFNLFTKTLKISETEVDSLLSVEHSYGYVNNSPYEVLMGGNYGGIISVYLKKFSDFSGIDFNCIKYRNYNNFAKAIASGDVELYFNFLNIADNYQSINAMLVNYTVVSRRDNNVVIDSINSLKGKTVYVRQNSLIYDYIKGIDGINVETFSTSKDLKKLNKQDVYLLLDTNSFDFYRDKELDNYTIRYNGSIPKEYQFKAKDNNALYKLFNRYVDILDSKTIIFEGLNNHFKTVKSGSILKTIAEYILYLTIIFVIIGLFIFKKSKKVVIAKKIKKDDKLRFIDQLTSLKNRNFLNENISIWNNNTIYPQTIVVIDLNRLQEINDMYGYNEGDKQIMAGANVLVKTQLDNSEIMRTDGNEFVIYLVGYSQKQVTNYIHKLNREFKKLPYSYGAEFGYSMINDDIKTIEDALNEAVEDMKRQKSDVSEKQVKK